MKGRLTPWALGLLSLVAAAAVAQEEHGVKKEDVKTWTIEADGKEYEVRPATPTYFGDTGLFHISSAYTLTKGKTSFSLFRDNLDRDPKDIDFSVHGVSLAYGLTSKLELFAQIGVQNRLDLDAPFQGGFYTDLPFAGQGATTREVWETGFGDVRLGLKFGFLNDHDGDPIGLAVKGAVKLGTADEAKGLGTGKTSFEAHLIASKALGNAADIHGSIGYQSNSDPDGVNIANAMIVGGGINIPACRTIQLQADVRYTSFGSSDFEQTNPLDVVVGPVLWIKPGFFIRPAISWNFNFDDRGLNQSSKSWTGRQISIGYHPGTKCHPIVAPPPPPTPTPMAANKQPTVSCEAEKSSVKPGETVKCRAVGSDPDGDTLTYTWTADKGKVTPNGAEATWDSTGVDGTATITVRVTDGKGGSAEARCRVDVRRPEQPVTCIAAGFPPNRDRLNNVDKACLDDMASRLRSDPRSRLVIIGHADSKERSPEVIARRRAEAAKNYLVKERGIDESRISVRSEAARKPADTGTTEAARKKNRRVEIWFLPEGSQMPE
jgi:outer membrane protein OmpA-like peptidoglycan-associated protein